MTGAGDLRERVRFEQRGLDANDNRLGNWDPSTAFTRAAQFIWLQGGEPVLQQRFAGSQPVVIRVYDETASRAVETAWSAVDTRTGRRYDIKSNAPAKDQPAYRDLLAVELKGEEA